MSDNSWYEKRLNPPVGTVCEAMFDGVWHKVEILKYAGEMNAAACLLSYTINGRNLYWSSQFRPIKTERDLAIEEMKKIVPAGKIISWDDIAEIFYDAGYRKNES